MQRLALLFGAFLITLGMALSYLSAVFIANYTEHLTTKTVTTTTMEAGYDWASIRVDGLTINVSGPAPDEATRFNLLSLLGETVNSDRIVDRVTVVNARGLGAPKFTLELLRNGDGISLIGLVPENTGRDHIMDSIDAIADGTSVTDMLETADHEVPHGWEKSLEYGLDSLRKLPRSKISVTEGKVIITAISDSPAEKKKIETDLSRSKPSGVLLVMNISSPRPVITPFSLRLIIDEKGTRFDSCSADTEDARSRIVRAALKAGISSDGNKCTVGLGVPTPRWAEAVESAITALQELKGGSLTFSDADITLVAHADVNKVLFDRVTHKLENALPDVFSLHAVLPPKPVLDGEAAEVDIPEFLATKSPEGLVQLRGRMRDERAKLSVHNIAKALFGSENIYDTTRVDPALPDGWPIRVLAGLEALNELHNGSLLVQPNSVEIRGVADELDAKSKVTTILSVKLGDASNYSIHIKYEEALNRLAQLPTPEECVAAINEILTGQKIVFAPGSTKIEGDSAEVVEHIAEAMTDCSEVPMEIGGHTDSQGRESLNQTISQARAEAVLDALLSHEILTTFITAKGYGEGQPIADNETEEGRAENRRIEFRLMTDDEVNPDGSAKSSDAGKDSASDNSDAEPKAGDTPENPDTSEATDEQN